MRGLVEQEARVHSLVARGWNASRITLAWFVLMALPGMVGDGNLFFHLGRLQTGQVGALFTNLVVLTGRGHHAHI